MRRNISSASGIWLALIILMLSACSGDSSTSSDPTDGDFDPDNYFDTEQACTDDEGCNIGETCFGGVCYAPLCTSNSDCDYATGCYCQVDHCQCPPNPDGDSDEPDGDFDISESTGDDPFISTDPSSIDFGAVRIGQRNSETLSIYNAGAGILQVNDARIVPKDLEGGASSRIDEFDLVGNIPSGTNKIELGPGTEHTFKVTYEPDDPGIDEGILLLGSNAGTVEVPLLTREKGETFLEVECESPDTDYVPPGEEYAGACSFGLVPVGDTVVMPIHIRNKLNPESNKVLIISDIELENPLSENFAIDRQSIDINGDNNEIWLAPGQTETFNLIYHPRSAEFHSLNLLIDHNDTRRDGHPEDPYPLMLVGAGVVPDLAVNPDPIHIGSVAKDQCLSRPVTLCNNGGADLVIDFATLRDDRNGVFSFDLPLGEEADYFPLTVAPFECNEVDALAVTCCPKGREAYSTYLDVTSNDRAQHPNYRYVPIDCTGTVPFCGINPLNLNFECIRVGSSKILPVVVSNSGDASVVVQDVQFDPPVSNFSLDGAFFFPITIDPYSQLNLDVAFEATSEGNFQGQMNIIFSTGSCESQTVQLTACAIEPHINGPTGCLEFNDVQVPPAGLSEAELEDWRETKQVVLSNDGTAPLTIASISIPNIFSDEFEMNPPPLPYVIPPLGSLAFDVSFLPDDPYPENGVLVVCSDASNASGSQFNCNDPTMDAHEICLTATPTDPRLDVTPLGCQVVFRNVLVGGDPVTQEVVIRNIGIGPATIEDIRLGSGSPDISIPDGGISPAIDTWPAGGYVLPGDGTTHISVIVKFEPTIGTPYHTRSLEIVHTDKDAHCLNEDPGAQYPIYSVDIFGSSSNNTPPIAIAKSPVGTPAGPYGTRELHVRVGEEINLDGTASYDLDDDPETPETEDSVVEYLWEVDDPSKVTFTGATNGYLTAARFDHYGVYTISLRVKDERDTWSDETLLDSKLRVYVEKTPTARLYECDTLATSLYVETGTEICFDGSLSEDEDGSAVADYRWFIQEAYGQRFNFAVGTSQATYTFRDAGVFTVILEVENADGVTDEAEMLVETYHDQGIRVEMVWTGLGNVDMHWLRPGGYFKDVSDCWSGNPSPNWGPYGQGHPLFEQSSPDGNSPEVVSHDDPGNGSYTVKAEFVTPTENCRNETKLKHYSSNCDMCDCDCKPFCLILRICCNSCDVPTTEWVCDPIPANLTLRMYAGSDINPTCVSAGNQVTTQGQIFSLNIVRDDGEWICP